MSEDKKPPARIYLGEWLDFRRMKQADLCRATGITDGYVSSIVKGRRKNVSLPLLAEIARALKIPPGYLLFEPTALAAPVLLDRAEFAAMQSIKDKALKPKRKPQ